MASYLRVILLLVMAAVPRAAGGTLPADVDCLTRDVISDEYAPGYHNLDALETFLECIHMQYPDITHRYSIGNSSGGLPLLAIALASESPDVHEELRPEVKYVGGIHGDETIGREMLIYLIDYLVRTHEDLTSPEGDRVRALLGRSRVHILVSMNPDGFEVIYDRYVMNNLTEIERCLTGSGGRGNAAGSDLNRNFPDYFNPDYAPDIQPETRAIMRWIDELQFTLSMGFHGGAEVVNYPYDSYPDLTLAQGQFEFARYIASGDDSEFRFLALTYSLPHPIMRTGHSCFNNSIEWRRGYFRNGITSGARWYPVLGGMQDYNYVRGVFELATEMSCCKMPEDSEIWDHWMMNKESLIAFLELTDMGIKGIVADAVTHEPIGGANVLISGRDFPTPTTDLGEYWHLLLPNTYVIKVTAEGYAPYEGEVSLTTNPLTDSVFIHNINMTVAVEPTPTQNTPRRNNTAASLHSTMSNSLKRLCLLSAFAMAVLTAV